MHEIDIQRHPVRDHFRFLRTWLRSPTRVGAVMPSGRSLAAAMAAEIDPAVPGAVIELGGGTGNITAALLDGAVTPANLVVIEQEPSLCRVIAERFPNIKVICGDARRLRRLLREAGIEHVKAVVSGLPLLSMPKRTEHAILSQVFSVLPPDGVYVQFTYGPRPPISRTIAVALDLIGDRSHWVLDNIPPAAVWNYQKREAFTPLKHAV